MNRALVRQMARFVLVGVLCLLLQIVLYALLRIGLSALTANFGALTVCTVVNTEANRRFTFTADQNSFARTQLQGLLVFAAYYLLTSGALLLLQAVVATPSRRMELAVLAVSSAVGTVGRFVVLRLWVFRRRVLTSR
ncbi:GtrA family protein [Streptomyces sp. NPDC007084]|uniref:GtrA family protein n=1 Tax=Streptomyces sp. NPDC007084 TaxID=3154313 RepID=UPI0034529719